MLWSSKLLYCTLTKQPVCKMPKAVQGHVQSKRFKRLLQEATEGPTKPSKKLSAKRQEKTWALGQQAQGETGGEADSAPRRARPNGANKNAGGGAGEPRRRKEEGAVHGARRRAREHMAWLAAKAPAMACGA